MAQTQPQGYLAIPPSGTGPGVLVLHAWWGLNDTMKAFCRQLADHGFVAFAPDLYHGRVAEDIPDAEALADSLDTDRARDDLADAITFLSERASPADPGLAVIGFSLGAFFALDLSISDPERIRSVVIFYGTRPGDYSPSKADYLGHFAETDEYEPRTEVHNLEQALRNAGRPVAFHIYEGTGHWFYEPDRLEAFNQGAASLAWERTLAFLKDDREIKP